MLSSPTSILSTTSSALLLDTTRTAHGDPGGRVVYHSTAYGDIRLQLPEPEGVEERRLFAHYVWNAGVLLGEMISGAGWLKVGRKDSETAACLALDRSEVATPWKCLNWSVEGESVLELGAGESLSPLCILFHSC